MNISQRSSRRLSASLASLFALIVMLLAIAWHFAGYEPTAVISLSGIYPLAMKTNGEILIAGTQRAGHNLLSPHVVGPVRFLDPTTGNDKQPPLTLGATEKEWVTISSALLSGDEKRLVVVRTQIYLATQERYFVTVFDLPTREILLEKTIPFDAGSHEVSVAQLSPNGRLLALRTSKDKESKNRAILVWDLETGKERFQLPGRNASFQFSPDGKMLVTREMEIPERFHLSDTNTGDLVHEMKVTANILGFSVFKTQPTFSPDSKFVAVDNHAGFIHVFETASGKPCFDTEGWSPQFLPGGWLLGVRNSGASTRIDPRVKVPEIVVWSSDSWTERRAFPYDFGVSILSGTVLPHPWPTGRGNQFGLIYETTSGWTGSTKWSGTYGSGLRRSLRLNVPRGLGLDLVDPATGTTRTYHLDDSWRWFPFPQAGKLLVPNSDNTAGVWAVPPRQSYRAVAAMVAGLAAMGILWYALRSIVRLVARRYPGRQPSS